jgi:lipid-binding SYLF domain-containing protein
MMLPPKFRQQSPQRVCRACAALLGPLQDQLAGVLAEAAQPPVRDAPAAPSWRAVITPPYGKTLADDILKAASILHRQHGCRALRAALRRCAGVAVLSVLRVGAGWSVSAGTGVVLARRGGSLGQRAQSGWGPPCAVALAAAGFGWQAGAQLTHLVLVLKDAAALRALCGASVGVQLVAGAAAGPAGREGAAAWRVGNGGQGVMRSWSASWGAFAGAAVEGCVVRTRDAVNREFYGRARVPARALLLSDWGAAPPAACSALYAALDAFVDIHGEEEEACSDEAAPAAAAPPPPPYPEIASFA